MVGVREVDEEEGARGILMLVLSVFWGASLVSS
jgi:hypothetical protein